MAMAEFHGVIVALEFCCWLAAVGVSVVIALLLVVLANQIADKTGDDDEDN